MVKRVWFAWYEGFLSQQQWVVNEESTRGQNLLAFVQYYLNLGSSSLGCLARSLQMGYSNMQSLTFSGHETFHCRPLWLKKGIDFIAKDFSFTEDSAVVELGVGRNMVAAIRFWLHAFAVSDKRDQLTELGKFLFGEGGKDPYLEDIASLWLLHHSLVTSEWASIYSLVFNEFRKERVEFNKEQLVSFLKRKCEESGHNFNEGTIANDTKVFVKSYLRPYRETKTIEEGYSGLFIDLDLLHPLERFDETGSVWYKLENKEREDLPIEVVLFSILDNENYGLSISFNQLLNGRNSVGMVYALSAAGLMDKISEMTSRYPSMTFSDDAGIRELQFKEKPNKWNVLSEYYGAQ